MSVDVDRMLLALDRQVDRLINEMNELRRRLYAWQMLANDLKTALEIQHTVYSRDDNMCVAGMDAINQFEKLQAKEFPTPTKEQL